MMHRFNIIILLLLQIPYILRDGTEIRATKCTHDATIVAKLRAAGAMIIGMANMHELGTGITGNNVSRLV